MKSPNILITIEELPRTGIPGGRFLAPFAYTLCPCAFIIIPIWGFVKGF